MQYANALANSGLAFSGLKDGLVYGCGGVLELHPGVGQAWTLLTWRAIRSPMTLYKAVKRHLPEIAERGRFHRIQAHVITTRPDHMEFAERFGFEFEGLKRKYDSAGNDYFELARIFKENLGKK